MKILPFYNSTYLKSNNIKNTQKKHVSVQYPTRNNTQDMALPSYKYHLTFCGGNSLSLASTIYCLDQHHEYDLAEAKEKDTIKSTYPPNVRENAARIIKEGNPEGKRLIDVHKETYHELASCDTLDELRFFFPEFSNVKDARELDYKKNSFLDKFFNGELKGKNGESFLNPEKDLALQLIQAYYLDVIPISDLTDLIGANPYNIMSKLNIPTFTIPYGKYLALSDEEKNKVITDAIKRNRNKPKLDKTSRKTFSEIEHKRRVIKSLDRKITKNPELIFSTSKENEDYLDKNPEENEVFSIVLERAWASSDGKKIRKKMSKFFKKGITPSVAVDMMKKSSNKKGLDDFWQKHSYLKEIWSKALKASWNKQKENEANNHQYDLLYSFLPCLTKYDFGFISEASIAVAKDADKTNPLSSSDIISIQVLDKKDREKLRDISEDGIEYYKTGYREALKKLCLNENFQKEAELTYGIFLDTFNILLFAIETYYPDYKNKASLACAHHKKIYYVLNELSKLLKKEEETNKNKNPIVEYDIITKMLEICHDNGCESLFGILLSIRQFLQQNKNNKERMDIIYGHFPELYKILTKKNPELRLD